MHQHTLTEQMSDMIAAADVLMRRDPASERYRRLRYYLERANDQLRIQEVQRRRVSRVVSSVVVGAGAN